MNEVVELLYEKFVGMGLGTHIPNSNSCGLWPEEVKRLIWAELNSPNLSTVVIGSNNSSSELAIGIAKDYKGDKSDIISVDICFGDYYELNINRLKNKYKSNVVKFEIDSATIDKEYNKYYKSSEKVGMVFIDGYHSYFKCLDDFNQLKNHLGKGSIVCFHDCSPRFPKRGIELVEQLGNGEDFMIDEAINTILKENPEFEEIDLKLGLDCYYPHRTGLTEWVRGTTSSFNSLFMIKYV